MSIALTFFPKTWHQDGYRLPGEASGLYRPWPETLVFSGLPAHAVGLFVQASRVIRHGDDTIAGGRVEHLPEIGDVAQVGVLPVSRRWTRE